ncbi:MAG: HD domain-containing protein [Desulfovibrio sp.]|jgi:hypothetical protein|nr:HD domain-containing protein [Desulfovibrio sp.]
MTPAELLLTKTGGTVLALVLLLCLALLLRRLYGQRGPRRDPSREAPARDINTAPFLAYARGFFSGEARGDSLLALKAEHTLRVLEEARAIAASEPAFSAALPRRALLLAALYHDLGRFEQLRRYRTFVDARSCNHGLLGARILSRGVFLAGEPEEVRRLVLTAVALHNRQRLPEGLSGPGRLVTQGVRDADKMDILRIMAGQLAAGAVADPAVVMHLADEPQSWSAPLLSALEEGRTGSFSDMRFYNDFRLLLCTWLQDLTFAVSLRRLRDAGHLEAILGGLAAAPEAQARARRAVEAFFRAAADADRQGKRPCPPSLPDR